MYGCRHSAACLLQARSTFDLEHTNRVSNAHPKDNVSLYGITTGAVRSPFDVDASRTGLIPDAHLKNHHGVNLSDLGASCKVVYGCRQQGDCDGMTGLCACQQGYVSSNGINGTRGQVPDCGHIM